MRSDEKKRNEVRIVVGGDICPIGRASSTLCRDQARNIIAQLGEEIATADLVCATLDGVLCDSDSPIRKTGPHLRAPVSCARGIRSAGINVLSLASNHVLDHGVEGFRSTVAACRDAGLTVVGAGENEEEALRMQVVEVRGVRVALMGMAEREWSIATRDRPGAAPADPVGFVREVQRRRGEFDVLVVLYHGGLEMHPYPAPEQQRLCRFFVEMGASAVICSHSHVAGALERWKGGIISYGTGNLIFDGFPLDVERHLGYLVCLRLVPGERVEFKLVHYEQFAEEAGVVRLSEEAAARREALVLSMGREIEDENRTEARFLEAARKRERYLMGWIHGYRRWLSAIDRRFGISRVLHSPDHGMKLQNLLSCETSRELALTLLADLEGSSSRERCGGG